jgi:hypothetical protein
MNEAHPLSAGGGGGFIELEPTARIHPARRGACKFHFIIRGGSLRRNKKTTIVHSHETNAQC